MFRFIANRRLSAAAVAAFTLTAAALAGCAGEHSPDIYAAGAVQQANKVDQGVVVGFRQVVITSSGTVGAVTGGAAGGILGGSQAGALGVNQALGTVAGSAVGGIIGNTIERVTGDTAGWEYIVRKPDGDMVSVTQREKTPIAVGQKVLVIGGAQARIVPDYSKAEEAAAAAREKHKAEAAKPEPAKPEPQKTEAPVSLVPSPTSVVPAELVPSI